MFDGDGKAEQYFPLRAYQAEAVSNIRRSFAAGNRRVLFQLSTGGGKTRIIAEIAKLAREKNSRVVLLAPRRELVYQIRDALRAQGVSAGVIMANERETLYAQTYVCSFDTLHARAIKRNKIELPKGDIVIVDEAHLAVADGRQEILNQYADCKHLLFTATPARGDGRGLCEIADDLVLGPSMPELIELGHLVPLRYFAPSEPDLRALKLNKDGDYQEKALGEKMDDAKLIGDIVDNWMRLAPDRRTVVFCVNRKHSRHVCAEFVARGVAAEHLDGETPVAERADILARVADGATQVLCNVFVASYGLDIPPLDCAVLARPTKNLTLYLQTVGRVMRVSPGKVDALVIDHSGAVKENGFADDVHPWSLDGKEKIKDRIEREKQAKGEKKEIVCGGCGFVFKGSRTCPKCGHQMVPPSEPIPTHKADLKELDREASKGTEAEKRNRKHGMDMKVSFIGELKAYAKERGKADGWVAHKYREYYSVWPNDPRLRAAPATTTSEATRGWIRSRQIAYARRSAQ